MTPPKSTNVKIWGKRNACGLHLRLRKLNAFKYKQIPEILLILVEIIVKNRQMSKSGKKNACGLHLRLRKLNACKYNPNPRNIIKLGRNYSPK